MEEQFLFYWSLWLLFIIVFFFVEEKYLRRLFLFFVLLSIIASSYTINISQIVIQLNLMIILLLVICLLSLHQAPLKLIFYSFILAAYYIGLLFWQMIAPVWFIYTNGAEIVVVSMLLTILLAQDLLDRILVLLLGCTLGHLLYSCGLVHMHLSHMLGHLEHYIYLQFAILILLFISAMKRAIQYVYFIVKEVG